jgi:hypothetical protein
MKRLLFLILLFIPSVYACGCGLAISDIKVFNDLKETQAYLMIDVMDEFNYNEMPFFRMVSMDEPYNVTIVFPISGIPYDVQGRVITAEEFLEDYNVGEAEKYLEKQSFSGIVKKVREDFKENAGSAFMLANGFLGLFLRGMSSGSFGAAKGAFAPLAHYEFEGGSLDIYDVNSMATLEEFVRTVNITLTGEVKELVTKYKDYFVAVLYLNVPSVMNEFERLKLRECPEADNVKKALQEKTEFSFDEISELTGLEKYYLRQYNYADEFDRDWYFQDNACGVVLARLIYSVSRVNSKAEGTLVIMKFNSNAFFYPTSIVNSYKYPITDEKYFIRTPRDLHVQLDTSDVDKIAAFDSERWYKVGSSEEDISGHIVKADKGVEFGDKMRAFNQNIYDKSGWIVFGLYMLIVLLPFIVYIQRGSILTFQDGFRLMGLFLLGGFLLCTIAMYVVKRKRLALASLSAWILILLVTIV